MPGINVFHNVVSDIKTVDEITMKKQKMVVGLLTVLTSASRPLPELDFLNPETRGRQGRGSRTIRRSTLPIARIVAIA
jgi:hypothetical protein